MGYVYGTCLHRTFYLVKLFHIIEALIVAIFIVHVYGTCLHCTLYFMQFFHTLYLVKLFDPGAT